MLAVNAAKIDVIPRILLQSRLAAVGHGLVERLEVFERGLGSVRRCRAEVFVEPLVGSAPGAGLSRAQLLGEVFAQQRMSIKREERAGSVAVYRQQPRSFEAAKAVFPIVIGQARERFGEEIGRASCRERV